MSENLYEHPTPITAKVELLEVEYGQYTTYIFKDIDIENEYYMVTRYPNWIQSPLEIGDIGYLTYYIIFAGITKWYGGTDENNTTQFVPYKYTHLAFVKFIKDTSNTIKKDKNEKFLIKVLK